jgi:thiol-disulfide isomerase/thioredoxin
VAASSSGPIKEVLMVRDLDDTSFEATLAATPRAVVDFHAGWCGPCRLIKPKFKALAERFPHVAFFMVDGEAAPAARKSVQIDGLPFFGLYRDGQLVLGRNTARIEALEALVVEHFGAEAP